MMNLTTVSIGDKVKVKNIEFLDRSLERRLLSFGVKRLRTMHEAKPS